MEGANITTYYRELDTRLGRWWSFDPKATASHSPYMSMSGNPILYNDVLGDTLRGTSVRSGQRLLKEIINTFYGKEASKLRSLIKLSKDGKTIEPVDEDLFLESMVNLSPDQQALAYGYMKAINSNDPHIVAVVRIGESWSEGFENVFFPTKGYDSPEVVNLKAGGGVNFSAKGKGSVTAIVLNATKDVTVTTNGGAPYNLVPSVGGELLAHEMLGHGLGGSLGNPTSDYEDAIQLSNLYWKSQKMDSYFRDGVGHSRDKGDPVLNKSQANDIPSYLQDYSKEVLKAKQRLNAKKKAEQQKQEEYIRAMEEYAKRKKN